MSSCKSSVTSWRSETAVTLEPMSWHLRFFGFFLFRPRSQLVPCTPQRRVEVVMDHLPEHLDRRPLRADDLVADDPRDDLVVADSPHRHALVPLDQRLGELVELLVLAPVHVDVGDREIESGQPVVERLAEPRRHAPDLPEAGRVEAGAVTAHPADLL